MNRQMMSNKGVCFAAVLSMLCAWPISAQANEATVQAWPERATIDKWLARELQGIDVHGSRVTAAPSPAATPVALTPKPLPVKLLAVYGVANMWHAHVRIGGYTHTLRADGTGRADDGKGRNAIVAEHFDGTCLQLRYRATTRQICLDISKPGEEF